MQFEQSCWVKPYIDLNTEKRKEETTRGEGRSRFIYIITRINFEVVTSRKVALKRIAKPNFKRARIFHENLVGIHMIKPVLVMNRPIQVGFAILDLSKYLMYDFHYNTWMEIH